uniref:Uncharacterized protein n=1 Tax=Callorhinchus milii TaxID=7868 RepID=A0A4W3GDF7_CALMI
LWDDLRSQRFWRCVLAELLASIILVWVILGSSVQGQGVGVSGLVQVAVAGGFSVVSLVQCFGEISGAHVNPAVTVAFLCTRKLDVLWSVSYILAQCLGAILGSGMVYLSLPITSSPAHRNLAVTRLADLFSGGNNFFQKYIYICVY